jgi:hypothetical protein
MKTYIDNELSTVYTYKNSVADMTALEAVENPEIGDVYNVVAANGQPGDSGYTPAGTNYAWNGSQWDALGGVVDLSNYATVSAATNLQNQIDTINGKITGATGDVSALSGTVSAFSASVVANYALSSNTATEIENAKIAAEIASSAYTDSQIQMLSGITSGYIETRLSTDESDISDLKTNSATHTEVATQSATTFNSAYTAAVASAESYTDTEIEEAVSGLIGDASESGSTLGDLESAINSLSSKIGTDTNSLDQRLSAAEAKFTNSADTWNAATHGAEFASVTSSDSNYSGGSATGGTVDSNAKLSYTDGGKIKIDLSELIIDCGDF